MSSVSNFLKRLDTVTEPAEFEKVCEDVPAVQLDGSPHDFFTLFDRLVGMRNKLLGPKGVFNRKVADAIRHTVLEKKRVAPSPVDKIGHGQTLIFRSRKFA